MILNIALTVVIVSLLIIVVSQYRTIAELQKSLDYSEACLARADENNRRMLESIDQAKQVAKRSK